MLHQSQCQQRTKEHNPAEPKCRSKKPRGGGRKNSQKFSRRVWEEAQEMFLGMRGATIPGLASIS